MKGQKKRSTMKLGNHRLVLLILKANILLYLKSKKEEKLQDHSKDESSNLQSLRKSLKHEPKITILAIYSDENFPKLLIMNLGPEVASKGHTILERPNSSNCSQVLTDRIERGQTITYVLLQQPQNVKHILDKVI